MKKLFLLFTTFLSTLGWMGFPDSKLFPLSYQRHGVVGYWIGFVAFSMLLEYTSLSYFLAIIGTSLIALFIGYIIEFIQKWKGSGVFENKDAFFVMYGSVIISLFLLLIKFLF